MKLYEFFTHENKWGKGAFFNPTKETYCIVGALLMCYPINNDEVVIDIQNAIKTLYSERVDSREFFAISKFNDHPDTTFEDVLRVLKFADV